MPSRWITSRPGRRVVDAAAPLGRYLSTFPCRRAGAGRRLRTGLDTLFPTRHGITMTGIDASPSMIARLLREGGARRPGSRRARRRTARTSRSPPDGPPARSTASSPRSPGSTRWTSSTSHADAARLLPSRRPADRPPSRPAGLWSRLRLLTRLRLGATGWPAGATATCRSAATPSTTRCRRPRRPTGAGSPRTSACGAATPSASSGRRAPTPSSPATSATSSAAWSRASAPCLSCAAPGGSSCWR